MRFAMRSLIFGALLIWGASPLIAADISETEPDNDSSGGADTFNVGDKLLGNLNQPGDDFWTFNATAGTVYHFAVDQIGCNTALVAPAFHPNIGIDILDAAQGLEATADDEGDCSAAAGVGDEDLVWQAPTSGVYYVVIYGNVVSTGPTYAVTTSQASASPTPPVGVTTTPSQTPTPAPTPTMTEWGMMLFAGLLLMLGSGMICRRVNA